MTAYNILAQQYTAACDSAKVALGSAHTQALSDLKSEHVRAIAQIEGQLNSTIATCAVDKATLNSACDSAKVALGSAHTQALSDLKSEHVRAIAQIEGQLNSTIATCAADKAALSSSHVAEMSVLRGATLTTINAMNIHNKAVANNSITTYKKASANSYDLCVRKVESLLEMVYEAGFLMGAAGTNNTMLNAGIIKDHNETIQAICGVNSNALTEFVTNVDHIGANNVVVNINGVSPAGSILLSIGEGE